MPADTRVPADTTVLLRPGEAPGSDPWDELLRLAHPAESTTTRALARRWVHWLVPLGLTGLTGLAGAVELGRPGLWTDQLATWGMATTPWHEFWPVLRYVDGVLAPYYVLMHTWVSIFGDSDIALRAPSLLAIARLGRSDRCHRRPAERTPHRAAGRHCLRGAALDHVPDFAGYLPPAMLWIARLGFALVVSVEVIRLLQNFAVWVYAVNAKDPVPVDPRYDVAWTPSGIPRLT